MADIKKIEKEIVERLMSLSPEKIILFGSYALGTPTEDSDIDILVTFKPDCHYSFYDLMDIKDDFQKMFDREVDLVEKQSLKNPFRKQMILNNMEVINHEKGFDNRYHWSRWFVFNRIAY